jgi:hypothetical protein
MPDTPGNALDELARDQRRQQTEALVPSGDTKPAQGNGSGPGEADPKVGKAEQPTSAKVPDKPASKRSRYPAVFGIVGFLMWMLFFSMGVLRDSTPYRIVTDPTFRQTILTTKTDSGVTRSAWLLARAHRLEQKPPRFWSTIRAFFLGLSIYIPINLALLCFWAGLMGGASSRLSYELALSTEGQPDKVSVGDYSKVQLHYLRESPWSAALRSFVVYLVLLSGFYLAAGDPFKNIGSSQYLRLAGLVSCIAFAIGYDPSRFTELINSLPKPTGGPQR